MRKVFLFCEDSFHESFLAALIRRLAAEEKCGVAVEPLSATGGFPRMRQECRQFFRDLERSVLPQPDLIVVAADANCHGYTERKKELAAIVEHHPSYEDLVTFVIPDPHIERWMLVDPKAFQKLFGRGCTLPAIKCDKSEYKNLLEDEIRASGITPLLGGMEYVEDIVKLLDFHRAEREPTFRHAVREIRATMKQWT